MTHLVVHFFFDNATLKCLFTPLGDVFGCIIEIFVFTDHIEVSFWIFVEEDCFLPLDVVFFFLTSAT